MSGYRYRCVCVGVRVWLCGCWGGVRPCVCVLNKNMFISTLINYMLDCTNFSMYRVYVCIGLTCVCVYVCVCVCVFFTLFRSPSAACIGLL